MNQLLATGPDATWQHIAPHLDDALGELTEADRDALMLRYFEKKSAPEMAGLLGITEEAAQKRVTRAVERLRELFSRRKVTIGTGGLIVLISVNAVQSAPIGLAAAIATTALTGTAASTATVLAATKTIAMTTLQKTIIGAALAAAIGTGIFAAHQNSQLRGQNQNLLQQQTDSAGQIQQLQNQLADLTNRLADVLAENARLASGSNKMELLKLRGLIGVLHRQNGELLQDLQNAEKLDHPVFPTNVVSRDSWKFAGYDTPEDSLKSTIWAKSVGNEQVWRDGAAPEATNSFNGDLQGNTDEERSQGMIDSMKNLTDYQILSETPASHGEVLIQLEAHGQANGTAVSADSIEVMKQIDGKWKLYDQYNDSDLVAKLLNSLNSAETNSANNTPTPAGPVRVIGQ